MPPARNPVVKRLGLILISFAVLGVAADFKVGLEAYQRGDFASALAQWEPMAQAGDAHAEYNLGLIYAAGKGVPQDYAKAIEWYRKAADQGVAAAQYNLGIMYANGQGTAADPQEAAKWFLKAADQGVRAAALGLGNVYYESENFRNYTEAEKWYRKAAEEGFPSAAFSIGFMYDVGRGVQQDYAEALKWYRQAADEGYAPAMVNLGVLYYNGQGVKRDLIQAYAWFSRAGKRGEPRGVELIAWVTEKLSQREKKKAETVAESWQPSNPTTPPPFDQSHLFKPPPATGGAATAPATSPAAPPAPGKPTAADPAAPARETSDVPNTWPAVDRVIAIGDVHGDYEQFVTVLESAGIIDGEGNWIGGKTHLVQMGDLLDGGPDSRALMDLLQKLEKQAAAAGGAVHVLVGSHEAMNVYGDWNYVPAAEFASYAGNAPTQASYEGFAERADSSLPDAARPDEYWDSAGAHSAGFAERQAAFSADGVYGRWIRSHNAAIKIGRTLFVHAGLGPKYAAWSLNALDNEVRDELKGLAQWKGGIVTDDEGPLWYTGLATGDEQQLEPLVNQILKNFDVDRIVIGHTSTQAAIMPRFGGKVLLVDVGLSRVYDNSGRVACLEVDGGEDFALHRGQKLELPKDEDGSEMLRYLRGAAALDPQPSPLEKRIEELEKPH